MTKQPRPDCNTPTETPQELAARTEAAWMLHQIRSYDGVQIPERAGRLIVDTLADLLLRHAQQVEQLDKRIGLMIDMAAPRVWDHAPAGSALQDSCGGPH